MPLRENLVVNNKLNRVTMSRNNPTDSCPWKFDVLKTGIFVSNQISAGQLSTDSSSTETLNCLK